MLGRPILIAEHVIKMNEDEYFSIGWNSHRKRVHLLDSTFKTRCGREMNIGKRKHKGRIIGHAQTAGMYYDEKTVPIPYGCTFCKKCQKTLESRGYKIG